MPRLIIPGLDYTSALSLHRTASRVAQQAPVKNRPVKIVLGSFTTHQLATFLDLYLRAGRVEAEIYKRTMGFSARQVIDSESYLYEFRPEFIILATSWRNLGHRPGLRSNRAEVRRKW